MNNDTMPDYIATRTNKNYAISKYRRDEKTTIVEYKKEPTFLNVFEYLIKPIKDEILKKDINAKIQLIDMGDFIMLNLINGNEDSVQILSQLDQNYFWNGTCFVYNFICDSLDIKDREHIYEETEVYHETDNTEITIYKKTIKGK